MGSVVVGQHDGRAGHTPTQLSAPTCFFAAHRWDDHREPSPLENLHTTTDSEAEEQQKSEDWTKVRESHRVGLSGRVDKDEEGELGASKLHDWCDKYGTTFSTLSPFSSNCLSLSSPTQNYSGGGPRPGETTPIRTFLQALHILLMG